ncbi:MAG: NAD(P)/FAD-dependent oxidoreductase [Candidatus Helarchaeota archaeon]
MKNEKFDVVIIGSGPSGSLAAKKLADAEKKVLLIEKKALPRHKICSGLVSKEAQNILKNEGLPIPKAICVRPRIGKGVKIQKNINSKFFTVPDRFFNVFRRDFDYWLVLKASEVGAEVWTNTEFLNLNIKKEEIEIEMKTRDEITNQKKNIIVRTDYLIGADGGSSTVRKVLFPEFKCEIASIYQEYYYGTCDLDPRYFHAFLDKRLSDGYAWFNQKAGQLIIGVGAIKGSDIQKFQAKFIEYLEEGYGLRLEDRIRKEGCMEPNILSRDFRPGFKLGKDNIILVGEAAGLMNLFGEGIPSALKSGAIAANSILDHTNKTKPVFDIYLDRISKLKNNLFNNWENLDKFLTTIS